MVPERTRKYISLGTNIDTSRLLHIKLFVRRVDTILDTVWHITRKIMQTIPYIECLTDRWGRTIVPDVILSIITMSWELCGN